MAALFATGLVMIVMKRYIKIRFRAYYQLEINMLKSQRSRRCYMVLQCPADTQRLTKQTQVVIESHTIHIVQSE